MHTNLLHRLRLRAGPVRNCRIHVNTAISSSDAALPLDEVGRTEDWGRQAAATDQNHITRMRSFLQLTVLAAAGWARDAALTERTGRRRRLCEVLGSTTCSNILSQCTFSTRASTQTESTSRVLLKFEGALPASFCFCLTFQDLSLDFLFDWIACQAKIAQFSRLCSVVLLRI